MLTLDAKQARRTIELSLIIYFEGPSSLLLCQLLFMRRLLSKLANKFAKHDASLLSLLMLLVSEIAEHCKK